MDNFIFKSGTKSYYRISNAQEKTWYIPNEGCRIALNIYQPSSIRGKLFKSLFPVIKQVSFLRDFFRISVHSFDIQPDLDSLLCKVFQVEKFELAMFCGTPSIHKKTIIQVASKSKILGYCKLSSNKGVSFLLKHEEQILMYLSAMSVYGIPRPCFHTQYEKELTILIQTTLKSNRSENIHKLTAKHWKFLNQLSLKTKQLLYFKDSDFYASLQLLKSDMSFLSGFYSDVISSTISETELHYEGLKVEFSVCHADFTPWNMFLEKGELFVFDWEYAVLTCPPFLDAFHFFTQTHIFVKHSNAKQIYKAYIAEKNIFGRYISNPDFIYRNYLLFILSFYVNRDKGMFSDEIAESISVWINLLEYLVYGEEKN